MSDNNGTPKPDNKRLLPFGPKQHGAPKPVEPFADYEQLAQAFNRIGATLPMLDNLAQRGQLFDGLIKRIVKMHGTNGLKVPAIPLHPQGELQVTPSDTGWHLTFKEPGPGIISAHRMPDLPKPKGG